MSMKEIGGYFGLEEFTGTAYHRDAVAVNSGRNALLYILKARNYHKLYIPYFLCDSVSELCKREGYAYEEYAVDRSFMPLLDKMPAAGECVYIVNFYGQLSCAQAEHLQARYGNIIFDNVQAFFQKPVSGMDTVYSCRKFFGVPDGGYVYCDAPFQGVLETDRSKDRMVHILGRFEETGSAYYGAFQDNDESFYDLPLKAMSPITRNLLNVVPYDEVRAKRNRNFSYLSEHLGALNGIEVQPIDGAYCYPFYCENGMTLRKRLAEQRIYVAILWPNVLSLDGTLEQDMAANILPLPCDQRYDIEDMRRLLTELKI